MILRQLILLILTAAGAALWVAKTDDMLSGYPLWIAALLLWVAQSMFWLGFGSRDVKLLIYLAGAWVGVMACVGVLGTFIGGGVAAAGDTTAIRVALAVILLLPVLLLPRFRTLWPGGALPGSIPHHLIRSLFVLLQYAGLGLLTISLNPVISCVVRCE